MISDEIAEALLDQLTREFRSAQLYLAMSAYCSYKDFNGAAAWLRLQSDEEQDHALRIYDYLIDQAVHVHLGELPSPPSEFGTLVEVFKASLEHEREMTARLNDLSDLALRQKDHATYNMLQWFVNEQVEEEATVSEIIAKLNLVGGDGYGLLTIDNELGTRTTGGA